MWKRLKDETKKLLWEKWNFYSTKMWKYKKALKLFGSFWTLLYHKITQQNHPLCLFWEFLSVLLLRWRRFKMPHRRLEFYQRKAMNTFKSLSSFFFVWFHLPKWLTPFLRHVQLTYVLPMRLTSAISKQLAHACVQHESRISIDPFFANATHVGSCWVYVIVGGLIIFSHLSFIIFLQLAGLRVAPLTTTTVPFRLH